MHQISEYPLETSAFEPGGVRVSVQFDWDALEPGVLVDLVADGPAAPLDGPEFHAWVRGAVHGVHFALSRVTCMPCVVRVVELAVGVGNATAMHVAAAAAFAVWEGLEVQPTPEVLASIHGRVAESAKHPLEWLADFSA